MVAAVVISLGMFATPAEAQLRTDMPRHAQVKVVEPTAGFSLNRLFSPEVFQMRHSYSLGYSGFGGMGLSMGEYTNTMMWNFGSKLAARADIAFAHTPFGTGSAAPMFGGDQTYGKLYIKNAQILYRPTERTTLQLSVRQSPYGRYMSPYGYYGGYGYGGYGPAYGYSAYDVAFDAAYGGISPYGMRRSYRGEFSWR